MNLKSRILAIVTTVVFLAGSHIFTNQVFAISSIAKIIDSRCWTMYSTKWEVYVRNLRKT